MLKKYNLQVKTNGRLNFRSQYKRVTFKLLFFFVDRLLVLLRNLKLKIFYQRLSFLKVKITKNFDELRRLKTFDRFVTYFERNNVKRKFLDKILSIRKTLNSFWLEFYRSNKNLKRNYRQIFSLLSIILQSYSVLLSSWQTAFDFNIFSDDLRVREQKHQLPFIFSSKQKQFKKRSLFFRMFSRKDLLLQNRFGYNFKTINFLDNLFFWHTCTRKKIQKNLWVIRGKKFLKVFMSNKKRIRFSRKNCSFIFGQFSFLFLCAFYFKELDQAFKQFLIFSNFKSFFISKTKKLKLHMDGFLKKEKVLNLNVFLDRFLSAFNLFLETYLFNLFLFSNLNLNFACGLFKSCLLINNFCALFFFFI